VSAKSNADFDTAPVRVDLVVPAVGISLPVLLVWEIMLRDVVQAEVVLTADKAGVLVDTAALWRGALNVGCGVNAANVTHGTYLLVFSEGVVVYKHVLASVSTLLSVATAGDAIVMGHLFGVELLGLIGNHRVITHIVLKLQSLRGDSKQNRSCK